MQRCGGQAREERRIPQRAEERVAGPLCALLVGRLKDHGSIFRERFRKRRCVSFPHARSGTRVLHAPRGRQLAQVQELVPEEIGHPAEHGVPERRQLVEGGGLTQRRAEALGCLQLRRVPGPVPAHVIHVHDLAVARHLLTRAHLLRPVRRLRGEEHPRLEVIDVALLGDLIARGARRKRRGQREERLGGGRGGKRG